jgi:hypothetical protein
MPPPTKLYAYVDESGQDTGGRLFVVGVVVTGTQRDAVFQQLEALEQRRAKAGSNGEGPSLPIVRHTLTG